MNRQRGFAKRGSLLVGLAGVSVVYVALKAAETLITDWSSWTLNWRGWLVFIGFVLAIFWYAVFAMFAEAENWFGSARRFVNALILGAASVGVAWWWWSATTETMAIAGTIGTLAGFFAEKWVDNV